MKREQITVGMSPEKRGPKMRSNPGVSKLAGCLAALSVVLMGCAGLRDRPAASGCCASLPSTNTATAGSVYDLAGLWTTDAGKEVSLRDLKGRPRIVAMFYSACAMTCPMTLDALRGIEAHLPPNVHEKVGFVLLTLDPAIDTPKTLRRYRREHRLPENRWTLLHGAPRSVARVASTLGVTYGRDGFGRLSHSTQISLLDENGRVVLQQARLNGDFKPMITHLCRQGEDHQVVAEPDDKVAGLARPELRSRQEGTAKTAR